MLSVVGSCSLKLPVDNRSPTATLVRDNGMADCILLLPVLLTVTTLLMGTAVGTVDDLGRSLLTSLLELAVKQLIEILFCQISLLVIIPRRVPRHLWLEWLSGTTPNGSSL